MAISSSFFRCRNSSSLGKSELVYSTNKYLYCDIIAAYRCFVDALLLQSGMETDCHGIVRSKFTINGEIVMDMLSVLRKSPLFCAAVAFALPAFGEVWFVDAGNYAKSGTGKSAGADAFGTIQEAVDAASEGDIIRIASGVYDDGFTADGFANPMRNRVYINKSLTLIGEDRYTTIVKGDKASVAEDAFCLGLGADAVRCIAVNASNVRIENLTLTGGATKKPASSDNTDGSGGAIYAKDGLENIVVADCIISNNAAYRAGGARYGNDSSFNMFFARCHFDQNRSVDRDPAVRGVFLAHCLLTGHFASSTLIYASQLVNCTIADGNCRSSGDKNYRAYNCLFADKWYKMDIAGAFYNNCVISKVSVGYGSDITPAQTNACVAGVDEKGIGFDHFVAPPLGDYRIHSGAEQVLNAGNAEYLNLIPEEFRLKDFFGNIFATNGPVIAAGCSQLPVTTVGGKIVFSSDSFKETGSWGGGAGPQYTGATNEYFFGEAKHRLAQMSQLGYVRAEKWPTVVKLKVDTCTWADVYGFEASGADGVWRFPYLDGTYSFVVPRSPSAVLTLTPKEATRVVYVDQESSSLAPDGSSGAPYTDLQSAIDSVANSSYAVIRSRGGVFSGETGRKEVKGHTTQVSVESKYVRIVGEEGPAENIITGHADPNGVKGMGANAVRCLYLNASCAVQGFTLAGGHTAADASLTDARYGGGAYIGDRAQLLDCVISNCAGTAGAAVYGTGSSDKKSLSHIFRCVIEGNRSIGADGKDIGSGVIRYTVASSSLFNRNSGQLTGSYEEQPFYFCTIADYGSDLNCLGSTSIFYNAIVHIPSNKINRPLAYGGVWKYSAGAVSNSSVGYSRDAALLADLEGDDFRPATVSPAKTAVDLDNSDLYHMAITRDVFGHEFVFCDSKPMCGAVHSFAPTVVVSSKNNAQELSGGGTNVFSEAGSIVFKAEKASVRPFLGIEIEVGGVVVTNQAESYTYYVKNADDSPETIAISVNALYDTNWYVDGGKGDDSGYGTAAQPKRTFAAALTNALPGDVVNVAAGTYSSGKMYQTKKLGAEEGDFSLASRAVVPDGVELKGAGADVTFIVGESDGGVKDSALSGCGKNAVRCVALGKGAKLSGFTLTGGRTNADGNSDSYHGGGVLASPELPFAEITDCVISNCIARRGGGAMCGMYNRCRFFSNSTVMNGNGAAVRGNGSRSAILYNSIVDDCVGWATIYMISEIVNCTVGQENRHANGDRDGATVIQDCFDIRNTLILGKKNIGVSNDKTAVLGGCAFSPETQAFFGDCISTQNCIVATVENLGSIDAEYRPSIGLNQAIDSAIAGNYFTEKSGEFDVYGNPRMVNGRRLDVGAVEADWKEAYSRSLGRKVSVTAASPDVLLDDTADGVQIPAGATFNAVCGRAGSAGKSVEISASVQDGCSLAVKSLYCSETLTAGMNQTVSCNKPNSDFVDFEFSASGSAMAILHGISRKSPFALVIR